MPRSSSSTSTEPLVRKAVLIETLGASFVQGQQCLGGPRRDTALFKEEQAKRLSAARSLLASSSGTRRVVVRPSLLTSPASAAAFALGAATALAASSLPAAAFRAKGVVSRALEGAAKDSFNADLAFLHRAGKGDDNERLRAVLRELRDARRAPDYGNSGGFAASSSSASWEEDETGEGEAEGRGQSTRANVEENVAAAVSAAEAAIRAAAGLVFRAGEKL